MKFCKSKQRWMLTVSISLVLATPKSLSAVGFNVVLVTLRMQKLYTN
ncbi:MAG: hypothetical protein LBO69_02920 [Ignavibacteria bacterium]|nr:hypothetical protein [Ignavibacteria bacterium]